MGTGVVDWDGTLYAPGYLIEENGAVPNYDKLVEDFKYFYDVWMIESRKHFYLFIAEENIRCFFIYDSCGFRDVFI